MKAKKKLELKLENRPLTECRYGQPEASWIFINDTVLMAGRCCSNVPILDGRIFPHVSCALTVLLMNILSYVLEKLELLLDLDGPGYFYQWNPKIPNLLQCVGWRRSCEQPLSFKSDATFCCLLLSWRHRLWFELLEMVTGSASTSACGALCHVQVHLLPFLTWRRHQEGQSFFWLPWRVSVKRSGKHRCKSWAWSFKFPIREVEISRLKSKRRE